MCIYQTLGDRESDEHSFFNYLYLVHYVCLANLKEIPDVCAEQVMETLNIPKDKVSECIEKSFYTRNDYSSYNNLLGSDREHSVRFGI